MIKSWGAIVTYHQKEDLALENIQRRGVSGFLPKVEHEFIRRRRHYRKDVPLFSGYVFFQINEQWRELFHLRGVLAMVMNTGRVGPATVKPDVIRELWLGYTPSDEKQDSDFEVGQAVRPRVGPFATVTGVYNGIGKHGRDEVLFVLFGREHAIGYEAGELIAA